MQYFINVVFLDFSFLFILRLITYFPRRLLEFSLYTEGWGNKMRKLLIACLNLLLVFNSIGFQVINATEVDPPSEETYEPGLQTEETDTLEDGETNESISTEENTNTSETSLPTEEPSTDTLNLKFYSKNAK